MRCLSGLVALCPLAWSGVAGAAAFELLPGEATPTLASEVEDPSVRILTGATVPLDFRLSAPGAAGLAEPAAPNLAVRAALGWSTPVEDLPPTSVMRLWLNLPAGNGPTRSTQAFVSLGTGTPGAALSRQWRPSAGVVMNLRSAGGWTQQMSLGSMLRFDMTDASQVALRFKGGRLGVQYRLQFDL